MIARGRRWLMLPTLFAVLTPAAVQAQTFDGSDQFRTYCAVCHGTDAKGNGPLASSMTRKPADLTAMARNNGGTFPADVALRVIDGREPMKGHGGPDMPVWGDAFSRSAIDSSPDAVKARIGALVKYLERLQEK